MLSLSRKSVPAIHRALRSSIQRRHFATPTPNVTLHSHSNDTQNLVEKIVQRYAVDLPEGYLVRSGDYVTIQPEYIMTHDNTGAVMQKFATIGATKFRNPNQAIFTLDHDVQNRSEKNLQKYSAIEKFAGQMSVDFYPAGRGIGHQIMIEEGYAFPNTLTVASDSHSNMYGGVGALGTPVVRTDAAAIWATGRTWWQIPPVVKVDLLGSLPRGVTGKDIIVTLCGAFSHDEVLNCAVEFGGDLGKLSIDDRLAIANMTTEWGALAGLFPVDHVTTTWLRNRVRQVALTRFDNRNIPSTPPGRDFVHPRINDARITDIETNPLRASSQAQYSKRLTLDLSTLTPHISGPNSVKVFNPLSTLAAQNIAIQKAYLVSCVNSRASDIRAAAEVVRGHKVADGVEFYIAAASSEVQKECEEGGHWQALLDAGARPLPAGCGPCIGLGTGLLKDGEVGISATNRNFKGRMGSSLAKAYLASPVVVAASAIAGKITGPEEIMHRLKDLDVSGPKTEISVESKQGSALPKEVDVLPGFPKEIAGELLFVTQDNLNTDGIYPGKYTYQDDIKREDMKKVVMENYDREFAGVVKDSDILIAGSNFGTGSSREQAATALLSAGIRLVLAASFSDIFKRNSINNALLLAECPELVQDLRQSSSSKELTIRTGWTAKADVAKGEIVVQKADGTSKKYRIGALGKSVQELWCAGGLEGWVKERL